MTTTSISARNTSAARNTSTNTCTCTTRKVCDTCNTINTTRKLLVQKGYYGYIQPNGILQYFNVFDVSQKLIRPASMLEIFESMLGFPIVLEDADASPTTKLRMPAMSSIDDSGLMMVESYIETANGFGAILFENGELVYSAITGKDHINNYKNTIAITDKDAFTKTAIALKKKLNPFEVYEALQVLHQQEYIHFADLYPQFRAYVDVVGGQKYLDQLTRNTGITFLTAEA